MTGAVVVLSRIVRSRSEPLLPGSIMLAHCSLLESLLRTLCSLPSPSLANVMSTISPSVPLNPPVESPGWWQCPRWCPRAHYLGQLFFLESLTSWRFSEMPVCIVRTFKAPTFRAGVFFLPVLELVSFHFFLLLPGALVEGCFSNGS